MKYKLISIEGTDGSGKATTTELLKQYLLNENNNKVTSVSFPRYKDTVGGKLLYEVLKSDRKENYNFINTNPYSASLLYVMDRLESKDWLNNIIRDNDCIIFDRYVDSNLLHQVQKLKSNTDKDAFAEHLYNLEYNIHSLPRPDIVLFLYLPPEIAIQKAKERAELENRDMDAGENDYDYINNSANTGLYFAKKYNWSIINCYDNDKKEQKNREEIIQEVINILNK